MEINVLEICNAKLNKWSGLPVSGAGVLPPLLPHAGTRARIKIISPPYTNILRRVVVDRPCWDKRYTIIRKFRNLVHMSKQENKTPQVASNIFHSIMKASVTPNKVKCIVRGADAKTIAQKSKTYNCSNGHEFSV